MAVLVGDISAKLNQLHKRVMDAQPVEWDPQIFHGPNIVGKAGK